jgi:hypothetical protein
MFHVRSSSDNHLAVALPGLRIALEEADRGIAMRHAIVQAALLIALLLVFSVTLRGSGMLCIS